MPKKRKSKSKKKRKSTKKRSANKSQVELLKEKQSLLFTRVEEIKTALTTNMHIERDELDEVIDKYGFDQVDTMEGFDIVAPVWDQMKEIYKVYKLLSEQIAKLKVLESKMLIHNTKKLVEEMEIKLAGIEKEEAYYTELPDKEGITKMKEKYHIEKEFWENRKTKFSNYLKGEHAKDLTEVDKEKMQKELDEANLKLKELSQKIWWSRKKNIQPWIAKYTGKVSKGISTVQKSIGEISEPFAKMGDMGGGGKKQSGPDYSNMFSSGGSDKNVGSQFEHFFEDPPRKSQPKKKKSKSKNKEEDEGPKQQNNWENMF